MGNSSTSTHSFYKIFTGQAQGNFRVPPPYVNATGGVLLDKYMLRGPNGEYRIVEVERNGGFWFFKGGWGDLVQKYPLSLSYGDILVFTLHTNVELHFQVYERNGCVKSLITCCGDEKGKQVKGQSCKKGTGYEAYEEEESSRNEILNSPADSLYDTCNESNDEEVVVSCKRAKMTTPVLDDEFKPVVQPGPFLRKVDLKDASVKIPDDMRGDSLNPVRKPNYRIQSPRKNSTKPTLDPKKEVHMDEQVQDRINVKREGSCDVKVVAHWHPTSMIHTMMRCSPERREKLIRSAQRLKLGRPLAGLILTRSCTTNGVLHLPKPFFQTLFNSEQLKTVVRKSGRLTASANGNSWPVKFLFLKGRVRITSGWSLVVRHYGLREGDLCFFQFIKTEPVIELRISTSHPRKSKTHTGGIEHI
ncbi:hypothetical protein Syun_005237 [Stephania yunnanensis]|uniref:TF-B3 domain-containing protein n=1 Tax=Stephania yunnanensis TaxID=152371 RepID=A0AAP0Q243_9MAGN